MTEILGEEKLAKTKEQMSLEEEIQRYLREECSDDDEPTVSEIAYHFAEWGAEHLRNSTKTADKSLEEAAENIYKTPFGTRAEDFIAGVEWKESQMLKDAVEGMVCATITGTNAISFLSPLPNELNAGDKVRIVVLKEEEEE